MCWGYQRRQEEDWRRARWQAAVHVNMNRASGTAAVAPEDLLTLPGDPPPVPPMSEETFDETMARLAEFDKLQPAA